MLISRFDRIGIRTVIDVMALVIVAILAFSSHVWAQDYDYPEGSSASPEPVYPGIPPKTKVETTIGSQQLRIYGTMLLNMSASDSVEVGQDLVLWPLPGGTTTFPDGTTKRNSQIHDLIFTARQSVFGFQLKPAKTDDGMWHASGTLEFDFFGGRPFDGNQPQGRVFRGGTCAVR